MDTNHIKQRIDMLRRKLSSQKGLVKANTLGQIEAYAYMLTLMIKNDTTESEESE